MDVVTKNLTNYVRERGINLAKMSRDTGIPYMTLYKTLTASEKQRGIRGTELLKVCKFLGVDANTFDPDQD